MAKAHRKIAGKIIEIDHPTGDELDWIFDGMQNIEVYRAFGCKAPPTREMFDAHRIELCPQGAPELMTVRYHILRRRKDARAVGFVIDFAWDYPTDPVREIDLAFPDPKDRGIGSFFDATIIIVQYFFINRLAKRLRWRVTLGKNKSPARYLRLGARELARAHERDPIDGSPVEKILYEFSQSDFRALCRRVGDAFATTDYGDLKLSLWRT